MQASRQPLGVRLLRFVLERFSPVAYGPLIVALVLAGSAGAALAADRRMAFTWGTVAAVAAVALGFLQLRILDELGDADVDRLGRPDRPLPRGLVTARELRAIALVAVVGSVLLAVPLGSAALACDGLALAQIWLLASGPGRRALARFGLLADALGHSLIVPTMLLVGWTSGGTLEASPGLASLLLLAWGAGLALELSRKIVLGSEERPGIQTYSRAFGRTPALVLLGVFLGATGAGASLVAATAGAVTGLVVLPIVVVGVLGAAALALRTQVPTGAVRAVAPALILAALAWPTLLAWRLA